MMNDYEEKVKNSLRSHFSRNCSRDNIEVQRQWPAFPRDKRYSPRVDVAVGPFALNEKLEEKYDTLCCRNKRFLDDIFHEFKNNLVEFKPEFQYLETKYETFNSNARCFIAIEIEKSGSRKHRLGDIVNVSALGRVGIIIAWDSAVLRSFLRILEYFNFLKAVGKNTFKTTNVAILERRQFIRLLNNHR